MARLQQLLAANEDFRKAYNNGEQWALDHARQVENLDRGMMHPERHFTDKPKRHCSRCPFKEGCISCDLP